VPSLLAHGIRLALVFGDTSVYGLNNIRSNRRVKDLINWPSARVLLSRGPTITSMGTEFISPWEEDESSRWGYHLRTRRIQWDGKPFRRSNDFVGRGVVW
jgi:hypothetical protein